MAGKRAKITLYVDAPLGVAQSVPLNRDQAHYLLLVMRLSAGDQVEVFNGRAGAWRSQVAKTGKRDGKLRCVAQSTPQLTPPDLGSRILRADTAVVAALALWQATLGDWT